MVKGIAAYEALCSPRKSASFQRFHGELRSKLALGGEVYLGFVARENLLNISDLPSVAC